MIIKSRVRDQPGLRREIIFHDLLLFACHCQGDILGMLSVHRRGDESLQLFLVTIQIQSVIPVSARRVLYILFEIGEIYVTGNSNLNITK